MKLSIESIAVYDYNRTMPKIFRRNCNQCGKYYENQNDFYCSSGCYYITKKGKPRPEIAKYWVGSKNPRWNNGRSRMQNGYITIRVPDHPYAHKGRGTVLEHRLVMEKHLGRYLEPKETVHHINHIRDDNRIENLQLIENHSLHMKLHHADRKKH